MARSLGFRIMRLAPNSYQLTVENGDASSIVRASMEDLNALGMLCLHLATLPIVTTPELIDGTYTHKEAISRP